MMLEQACPILPSRDVTVTEAFYARLQFATWYNDGDYMLMNRDQVVLHFFHHDAHNPMAGTHGVYIRPKNVDAFSHEVADLNLPRDGAPPKFAPAEDKPWGMREMTIHDPDGNLLRIGQEVQHG